LRADPDWRELTEEEKADARRGLDEVLAAERAKWAAVREFSEKFERERSGKVT
jgi:hypothetical protein